MGIVIHLLHAQPERPRTATTPSGSPSARRRPPAIMDAFEERFGMRLVEVYGSTELGPASAPEYPQPAQARARWACPAGTCSSRSTTKTTTRCRPNTPGEIVARPAEPFAMAQGYWNEPRATIDAFRNLWFHSGDGGYLDDEGYVVFTDRVKDCLRRRGENISSFEVERGVQRHPDVLECAAYAVPAELTEDELMIALVAREGRTVDPADADRLLHRGAAALHGPALRADRGRAAQDAVAADREVPARESRASRPTPSIARPPASPSPGARCTQDR